MGIVELVVPRQISEWVDQSVHPIILHIRTTVSSIQSLKLLTALLFTLLAFSLLLASFSIFLTNLFYDQNNSSGWFHWLSLSCVGLGLALCVLIGIRGAYIISLSYLLTYFWSITVFIAPIILGVIACFDFYIYVNMWFQHSWSNDSFSGLRNLFCSSDADTKCAAPLSGGKNYTTVAAYCYAQYNSTDCDGIRDAAILSATTYGQRVALFQAISSLVIVVIIFLTIYLCFKILTKEVIQESMNDVINFLLGLPIAGAVGISVGMWTWTAYGDISYDWFNKLYLAMAVCQVIALPMGIIAGKLKHQILMSIYVFLIFFCLAGFALGGSFLIIYSGLMQISYLPTEAEKDTIACKKSLANCCCCDDLAASCPEWSTTDVTSLLVLELKIYALISFLSMMYLIGALLVAGFVKRRIQNYKSDYV